MDKLHEEIKDAVARLEQEDIAAMHSDGLINSSFETLDNAREQVLAIVAAMRRHIAEQREKIRKLSR